PQLNSGEPDYPTLHRKAQGTHDRPFETAAERGAVNRRDDRLRPALDQVQHLVEPGLAGRLAELADVRTGDERPARAGEHDRVDRGVGVGRTHAVAQALANVLAERVD